MDARAVALGAADYLVKGQLDGFSLVRSIRYAIDRAMANERLGQQREALPNSIRKEPRPQCAWSILAPVK